MLIIDSHTFSWSPSLSNAASVPLEIDCRAVKARLDAGDDLVFVDCREPSEHEIVRIDGASLLPMSQFAARIGELEPHRDRPIVIHCHHGGRSLQVAAWLRQRGFAQAQSMAGGIDRWAGEIEPGMARY
ncbi:MAG: rhodanese [Planctomycetes bacterium]|nr:rhodanese [Planctomycetota bacterium]